MKIHEFQGEYRWMSNFWPANVTLDGVGYPTVEHAYQAAKTLDKEQRKLIRSCKTPGQAKRGGASSILRDDWHWIKVDVMRDLQRQKYRNPTLRNLLLSTGDAHIEEGNKWGDVFWGVCRGQGENWMGKLLMEIRAEIRKEINQ